MAYIDREIFINNELIPLVKRLDLCHPKQKKGVLMSIQKLNEEPTADVQEVKHSQWVVEAYDNQDNIVVIPYIEHQHCEPFCLICGKRALLNGAEDYVTSNYCPNCGAKMDLEEVD